MARESGRRDLANDRAQGVVEVERGRLGEVQGTRDRLELTDPLRPRRPLKRHRLGSRERVGDVEHDRRKHQSGHDEQVDLDGEPGRAGRDQHGHPETHCGERP